MDFFAIGETWQSHIALVQNFLAKSLAALVTGTADGCFAADMLVQFVEKRGNPWAGRLGYLTGLGRSSVQIAEGMGDGLHPAFVRTCWGRWGIRPAEIHSTVPLTVQSRVMLTWRAGRAGITPQDWLGRIAEAAIRDGLYEAIVGE